MLRWLHSLAAVMSGEAGNPDLPDAPAIDSDFRESGEPIEPRVPVPANNPLEELERLLR